MRETNRLSMGRSKGVSVVVSAVFVILISVIAISLVLLIGAPALQTARDAGVLSEAQGNMLAIDNAIREAVSEGAGIVKEARLQVSEGTYRVNPEAGSVDFDLAIGSDVLPRGFYNKEGNLVTSVTGLASASQNSTHLVLQNDVLEVVLSRSGNETDFGTVNTSSVLKTISFRDGSAAITPNDTSITISNITDTAWGVGYTKLAFEGSSLPKADALAHVRSAQGAEYDVLYTLRGSADFLLVSVLNASSNRTTISYAYRIGTNSSDKLKLGDASNVTVFAPGLNEVLESSSNATLVLENTNATRNSSSVLVQIGGNVSLFYNSSQGWRNVSELGDVGQGSWNFSSNSTHTAVNFTLAGSDGFDYGVRDSRPGGSYWLEANGTLHGKVNVSNDFVTVGMTETDLRIYNSSEKTIFNATFDGAIKVDNQNLISLYGTGAQNKTVYFFDWARQRWTEWGIDISDFKDDFDTDDWTEVGTRFSIDAATDKEIDWDGRRNSGTNNGIYIDLGASAVSETNWVLRGKLVISAFTQDASATNGIVLGIQNSTETDTDTRRDGIYFGLQLGNSGYSNEFHAFDTENELLAHDGVGAGKSNFTSTTPTTGTYFIEVIRNSATLMTVNIYSDPSYSVLLESKTHTTTSGVNGLRYLMTGLAYDGGTTTATFNGHWDDIKFWNGVSSVPEGMPNWLDPRNKQAFKWRYAFDRGNATATLNLTYMLTSHDPFVRVFVDAAPPRPDFSDHLRYESQTAADAAWVPQEVTKYRVDIANDEVDYAPTQVQTNQAISWDLGRVLGDSFVARMAFDQKTVGVGSSGTTIMSDWAFSSIDSSSNSLAARDALGLTYEVYTAYQRYYLAGSDGAAMIESPFVQSQFTRALQVETVYMELVKNGSTFSIEMFMDPNFLHSLERKNYTSVPSTVTGLRYFRMENRYNPNPTDHTHSGSLKWIQVWDNTSSVAGRNATITIGLPENRTSVTTAESGLVGYWNFNEGQGNNVSDSSGNGNIGRLSNGPSWVTNTSCKFGNCLSFDGADDEIRVPFDNSLAISDKLTVTAWVNTKSATAQQAIVYRGAPSGGDGGGNPDNYFFEIQSGGTFRFFYEDSGEANFQATSTITVPTGGWNFVAMSFDDAANTVDFYVNGTKESVSISGTMSAIGAHDLTIADAGDFNFLVNGSLDEVRIYRQALSGPEIRQLYLTGLNQQKPGIYFTKNNATDDEEVLFAATSWKNVNHFANGSLPSSFNVTSNHTNWFGFDYTFNSTQNQNFLFALGTMGRMNTTAFNPQTNQTQFSNETIESVANSTLTWYDMNDRPDVEDDFTASGSASHTANDQTLAGWRAEDYLAIRVNGTTDKMDFSTNEIRDDLELISYDLNRSAGPKWVLRGEIEFTGITTSANNMIGFGMFADDSDTKTGRGLMMRFWADGTNQFEALDKAPGNSYINQVADGSMSYAYSTGKYFMEITKDGANYAVELSSGGYVSEGGTSHGVARGTLDSDWSNLRYIVFRNSAGDTEAGRFVGTIDNIEFWDGVTLAPGVRNVTEGAQHTDIVDFSYDGGALGIWRFDDGGGASAADSSGNGMPGALTNGPTWVVNSSCRFGSCLSLDGTNDIVRFAGSQGKFDSCHRSGGKCTVNFWARFRSLGSNNIIIDNSDVGLSRHGFSIRVESSTGNVGVYVVKGDVSGSYLQIITGNGFVPDTTSWHMYTLTVDIPAGKAKLIRDASDVVSDDTPFGAPSSSQSTYELVLGDGANGNDNNANMLMDDLRIYSRVLADAEIRELYQREPPRHYDDFGTSASGKTYRHFGVEDSNSTLQPVTPSGAVLHYRFNDNSTLNSTDSSGTGNGGGVFNGAGWITNSSCKFGGCMSLDGSNDRVSVTDSNSLDVTPEVTISAWIFPRSVTGTQGIVTKYDADAGQESYALSLSGDELQIYAETDDSNFGYILSDSTNLAAGRWYHVVGTYKSPASSGLRVYVDGREVVGTRSITGSPTSIRATTAEVVAGAFFGSTSYQSFFNGVIDEAVIVNRSLSPDEVYQLYLGGVNRTIGGKWHRVASAEGVPSVAFNLTAKNNTLDGQDYDMRVLLVEGTSSTVIDEPAAPVSACFTLANITRPYACSYDDSELSQSKAAGVINAGPAGGFVSVCNDKLGSSSGAVYKFNLTSVGPLKAVLPFATGSCDTIGNGSAPVFSQGLPAAPFGSYPSGSLSNLQLSLQYDNVKLVGDMLLSAGQTRACFKKVGQDGSRIVVNATSC